MPLAADSPLVAVVDDDGLFRETISANLTEAGYRSVTFGGGTALLDWLIKGNRAAALLLDWPMPELDGPATLEKLRSTGHELPVLFLTRSEEHTSELQSLMRISYALLRLKKRSRRPHHFSMASWTYFIISYIHFSV